MKGGKVVTIRVNPQDCLSVLDVVNSLDIDKGNMTFATQVSLALTCAIDTLRKLKAIPENDGFAYLERMQPYEGGKSTKNRRRLTEKLYQDSARDDFTPPNLRLPRHLQPPREKPPTMYTPNLADIAPAEGSPEYEILFAECKELFNTVDEHTAEDTIRFRYLMPLFEKKLLSP